jgi:hypothetical protein
MSKLQLHEDLFRALASAYSRRVPESTRCVFITELLALAAALATVKSEVDDFVSGVKAGRMAATDALVALFRVRRVCLLALLKTDTLALALQDVSIH